MVGEQPLTKAELEIESNRQSDMGYACNQSVLVELVSLEPIEMSKPRMMRGFFGKRNLT